MSVIYIAWRARQCEEAWYRLNIFAKHSNERRATLHRRHSGITGEALHAAFSSRLALTRQLLP